MSIGRPAGRPRLLETEATSVGRPGPVDRSNLCTPVHAGRPSWSTGLLHRSTGRSIGSTILACSMRRFSLLCRPISVLLPSISSISSLPHGWAIYYTSDLYCITNFVSVVPFKKVDENIMKVHLSHHHHKDESWNSDVSCSCDGPFFPLRKEEKRDPPASSSSSSLISLSLINVTRWAPPFPIRDGLDSDGAIAT